MKRLIFHSQKTKENKFQHRVVKQNKERKKKRSEIPLRISPISSQRKGQSLILNALTSGSLSLPPFYTALSTFSFFPPSFLPSSFFLFLWQNWMFSPMKEGYGPRKIIRNAARLGRVNKADAKYTRSLNALSWRCSISRTHDLKGSLLARDLAQTSFPGPRRPDSEAREFFHLTRQTSWTKISRRTRSPPLTIEVTSSA